MHLFNMSSSSAEPETKKLNIQRLNAPEEKPFPCSLCDKTFEDNATANKHFDPKNPPDSDPKNERKS